MPSDPFSTIEVWFSNGKTHLGGLRQKKTKNRTKKPLTMTWLHKCVHAFIKERVTVLASRTKLIIKSRSNSCLTVIIINPQPVPWFGRERGFSWYLLGFKSLKSKDGISRSEKYRSEEWNKRVSELLNIPRHTVRASVKKGEKTDTIVTLPETVCPSRIDQRTRRDLIRAAAKRPPATLKGFQEHLASGDHSLHLVCFTHLGCGMGWPDRTLSQEQKPLHFCSNDPKLSVKMCHGLMRQRWICLPK